MKDKVMKLLRSTVAVAIALCMMLGLCANGLTVWAQQLGDDGTYHYVSIGASQTNGYGLQGYLPITVNNGQVPEEQLPLLNGLLTGAISKDTINVYGYQRQPEGSYPDLIRDALQEQGYTVKLDQMAISSMRAEEVRMLLDNDYYGDSYTRWRFYDENGNGWFAQAAKKEGMTNAEALEALRGEYQSAIANADLITMDIGVNNFGVYAINRIDSGLDDPSRAKFEADFSCIFEGEDLGKFQEMYNAVEQVLQSTIGEENPQAQETVQFMIDTFAYALIGFCVNFDKSMETIYTLNPDATVVVVSIQNLLEGMTCKVPGIDGELPLDEIYGAIVDMANTYTAVESPYADRYYYAAAGNVELFLDDILAYNGDPATLDQDMRDCFGLYDNSLFGWELFLQYGQFPGQDISAGTNAVYDALAQIAQLCAYQNVLDFGTLGDMDEAEDALGAFIEQTLNDAFMAGMSGQEYQLDTTVLENPDYASMMAIAIRFNIGNSFFAHPNRQGHAERAQAILNAIENQTTGEAVLFENLLGYVLEGVDQMGEYENHLFYYEVQEDSFYLAFGDDVPAGAYLNNYVPEKRDSYVDILARELGIPYANKAEAGMTALTLLQNLGNYEEEILKADLITVGFNTYGSTMYATNYKAVGDWAAVVGEENLVYVDMILNMIQENLGAGGDDQMANMLSDMVESFLFTYMSNLMCQADLVSAIRAINPEATVVLVGTYNDLENVRLMMGEDMMDLGGFGDTLAKLHNLMSLLLAIPNGNLAFINAPAVDTTMDPMVEALDPSDPMAMINVLLYVMMSYGMPTADGQQYIADQILSNMTDEPQQQWPEMPELPDFSEAGNDLSAWLEQVDWDAIMAWVEELLQSQQPEEPEQPEQPEPVMGLLGDVNGDGRVNGSDLNMLYRYTQEDVELNEVQLLRSDLNGDGRVNGSDLNRLYRYIQEDESLTWEPSYIVIG